MVNHHNRAQRQTHEEHVVKTEDRQEDQDENRLIRGWRGKAKDRKCWSTEEKYKIDTLKKEKTLFNAEILRTLAADSAADISKQSTPDAFITTYGRRTKDNL